MKNSEDLKWGVRRIERRTASIACKTAAGSIRIRPDCGVEAEAEGG